MTHAAPRSTSGGYNSLYLSLLIDLQSTSSSIASSHYTEAIRSLSVCPVPYHRVDDLEKLEGFSAGVRRKLNALLEKGGGQEKMERERKEEIRRKRARKSLVECLEEVEDDVVPGVDNTTEAEQGKKKKTKQKDKGDAATSPATSSSKNNKQPSTASSYIPAERSGAWGLMMALYLLSVDEGVGEDVSSDALPFFTKDALIGTAQKHCRSSYTYCPARSSNGAKFLTAWNSMKILLKRELVWQEGRPITYGLSKEGWRLAKEVAVRGGVRAKSKSPEPPSLLEMLENGGGAQEEKETSGDEDDSDDSEEEEEQGNTSIQLVLPKKSGTRKRLVLPDRAEQPRVESKRTPRTIVLPGQERIEQSNARLEHVSQAKASTTSQHAPRTIILPLKDITQSSSITKGDTAHSSNEVNDVTSNPHKPTTTPATASASAAGRRPRTLPMLYLPTKGPRSVVPPVAGGGGGKENHTVRAPVEVIIIDDDDDE